RAVDENLHGVNAVRKTVGGFEFDVGGRNPQGAAELPPGNNGAEDRVVASQEARGGFDVASLQGPADRRRGNRLRSGSFGGLDFWDDFDAKAVPGARLFHEGRRTRAVLSEMKIPADDNGRDAQSFNQRFADEFLRCQRRQIGVEGQDDRPVEAELFKGARLDGFRGQPKDHGLAREEIGRMRLESEHGAGRAKFGRELLRAADDCAMAEMRAVEIANRKDAMIEPFGRTHWIDGDHERFGFVRLRHAASVA
ncbi:MAG: hypothetical protein ABSE69_05190, partial [Roseiarcus sp.]